MYINSEAKLSEKSLNVLTRENEKWIVNFQQWHTRVFFKLLIRYTLRRIYWARAAVIGMLITITEVTSSFGKP